jgi:DNA-binding NtrC family response regulator
MRGPIVIIEDDPDIAEVLRYALEKEDFETRVALTGEEGLAVSLDRSNPPSIILLGSFAARYEWFRNLSPIAARRNHISNTRHLNNGEGVRNWN